MIRLAAIIETFEADFRRQYADQILPSQLRALDAIKHCRSSARAHMQVQCPDCDHRDWIPHSCGHRHCPHCQHHDSQQWLERQLHQRVPADYFLVTFTLPKALREIAWHHQREIYDAMIRCSWACINTFARNDSQLHGQAGAIAVLHTHSRRLDYHPHVHLVVPAAAIDRTEKRWRTKQGKQRKPYLFNHKALAKVFRAKLLDAINRAGLTLPGQIPEHWVVDLSHVGNGEKALRYLARYLYRGVISEKDIVACKNGQVRFRYQDSESKTTQYRTVPGAEFLALVLRHVLPKRFRRARNFGFLHPNSKRLIALLQLLLGIVPSPTTKDSGKPRPAIPCPCCGTPMRITRTRVPPLIPASGKTMVAVI